MKYLLVSLIGLGIILLSFWQVNTYLNDQIPDGVIEASGRIEGTEVVLSPKIAGRIELLVKDKGDTVEKGELLAKVSSEQIVAKVKQSQAGISSAEAIIREAGRNIHYWERKLDEGATAVELARKETQNRIAQTEAVLDTAKANLSEAEISLEELQKDYLRHKTLYQDQLVPAQLLDKSHTAYQAGEARVEAAGKRLKEAQASLELAKLGHLAVELREKEIKTAEAMLAQSREKYQTTLAGLESAKAYHQEMDAYFNDTHLYAPTAGTIVDKMSEEGEIVNIGTPILSIIDLRQVYLKVFIPEVEIGKVKIGHKASINVDAFPNREFSALVNKVSPQAEFTPKEVQTKEQRVKLVFAVELKIINPDGLLKPGMPADAKIFWKESPSF